MEASNCSAYTYTLTNGQIADANQVMSNFNNILSCGNNNLLGVSNNLSELTATEATARANIAAAGSGANTDITSVQLGQTGLKIADATTHFLTLEDNETLTANRVLSFITNDAARSITLSGNLTVSGTTTLPGGTVLIAANNLSDVSSASSARTNLGVPTGTSGHVLPFLDGTNTFSANQTLSASGSPTFLTQTTSASGLAEIESANDLNQGLAVLSYGSTAAGSTFGQSNNSASVLISGGALLSIGTVGTGNLIFGTNNTLGGFFDSVNQGFVLAGATGNSQGHGTINAQKLCQNASCVGTAAFQSTGTFLQTANNLSDVTASTARTNLGVPATTGSQLPQQILYFTVSGGAISGQSPVPSGAPGPSVTYSSTGTFSLTLGSRALNLGVCSIYASANSNIVSDAGTSSSFSASGSYTIHTKHSDSGSLLDPLYVFVTCY